MQAVFNHLSRFGQSLLIIGGQALAAHGVMRQTLDVDCLIAAENRNALDELLRSGGFSPVATSANFARYRHESELIAEVDVLFADAATFEKLFAASILLPSDEKIRGPSLPHLIALKLHAIRSNPQRESRDLNDIADLMRANPGAVTASELAALCAQFSTPDIAAKLQLQFPNK
jgi:predicted nucleotidyltransferase